MTHHAPDFFPVGRWATRIVHRVFGHPWQTLLWREGVPPYCMLCGERTTATAHVRSGGDIPYRTGEADPPDGVISLERHRWRRRRRDPAP